MFKLNVFRNVFISMCLLMVSIAAYGQPDDPPDPDVPISGIEILAAAGAAFGAKKYLDKRKNSK